MMKISLCTLVVLSLCLGCAASEEKGYIFQTIHETVLHSEMRKMANSLGRLASLYFDTDIEDAERHEIVINELNTVEQIASGIGGDDVITNYSVINHYMGAFLYDVALAKQFAYQEPPNYVPANRLLNSCRSCHNSL